MINKNKHKPGKYSPSVTNVCSGCNKDLGGNLSKADAFKHRC